jgi:hypothetical protein
MFGRHLTGAMAQPSLPTLIRPLGQYWAPGGVSSSARNDAPVAPFSQAIFDRAHLQPAGSDPSIAWRASRIAATHSRPCAVTTIGGPLANAPGSSPQMRVAAPSGTVARISEVRAVPRSITVLLMTVVEAPPQPPQQSTPARASAPNAILHMGRP